MLHEAHPGISGPAFLVIIANNVFIVGVWMFRQVTLDQIPSLIGCEPALRQGIWLKSKYTKTLGELQAHSGDPISCRTSFHFIAQKQLVN